jgi:hypothetical protein
VSNNNFTVQGVDRCNNGDYTTSGCPISGNPPGLFIYQIKYAGGGTYNGDCVGDNSGLGDGQMVRCNETGYPGTGGGTATIFVAYGGNGTTLPFCDSGFNYGLNSHYTNLGGSFGGPVGIAYHNQNDELVSLAGPSVNMQCLAYIPFG